MVPVLAQMKKCKSSYLFMAPFLILFLVFTVAPLIISIYLSFSSYNVLEAPKFIGWSNFVKLFLGDDIFIIALKNTFVFAAITGPISYVACLFMAWLVNDLPPKIRAFVTVILYAPSISGSVYTIWGLMFSGDAYGYVNSFLMKYGFIKEPVLWLQDTKYMLGVVILVSLWLSLGTSFLAFIAGFQQLDRALFEAGAVDGIKNRWQELWYITLPSMRPQLLIGAVLQITGSLAVGDVCSNLTGFPSVGYATHTVVLHMVDYGFIRFEMGYASAIALLLFLISITANSTIHRIILKIGE